MLKLTKPVLKRSIVVDIALKKDMLTTYEELVIEKSAQTVYHQFLMAVINDLVPIVFSLPFW